jgi:hypothetical protein
MKKLLFKIATIASAIFITANVSAQTAGTLTFTFTPVAKTSCYQGSATTCKWVLASWIQSASGTFEQTTQMYCCNGSTSDHVSTWSSKSGNNTTGANTGGTLSGFTSTAVKSFTWNGKNKSGVLVADGTYNIVFQETWAHGSSTATYTYTFTKGPNSDIQTPTTNSTYQTGVSLKWIPTATTDIEQTVAGNMDITIYPNPNNTGIVNVEFEKADNIKVVNTLGMVVLNENVSHVTGSTSLDLSKFENGIYFVCVTDGDKFSKHKVILNK